MSVNESLNRYSRYLMNIFFPRKCPFCKRPVGKELICENCEKNSPKTEDSFCIKGEYFQMATAPMLNEGAIMNAIEEFKTKRTADTLPILGTILSDYAAKKYAEKFDIISYVPSMPKIIKKLGIDPVKFLVASMCVDWHVSPVDILQTICNEQTHNLEYRIISSDFVDNKRILVVEDILDKKEVLEKIAKLLKEAGAQEVLFLALAKEID